MRKHFYTGVVCIAVGLLANAAWASPMQERIEIASNSNGPQAANDQNSNQYNAAAGGTSDNPSAHMAANNSGNGELVSITGCLNATDTADHFALKNAAGQWTQLAVAHDLNQKVASETGKTVRVVGVWQAGSSNSQSAANTSATNI